MTAHGTLLRLPRMVAALLLAAGLLLPATAQPARAADVMFGAPAATIAYGDAITFSVPISSTAPLERVELRLRFPDSPGPFITEVPVGPAGAQTLTYRLDLTGSGHLAPNTEIEATWAAVVAPGEDPVLSASDTIRYTDTDHDWRTLKGDLVVVHWYEGDEAFARRALEIGDKAVQDTAKLLGVTETEPVDFFIYADEASFREGTGSRHPRERGRPGAVGHQDAVRADHAPRLSTTRGSGS